MITVCFFAVPLDGSGGKWVRVAIDLLACRGLELRKWTGNIPGQTELPEYSSPCTD